MAKTQTTEHLARYECVIPDWLPAPVANGSRQKHWATIRRQAEGDKIMAWASAKQADWQRIPGHARLTITLVFPVKRQRDTDNTYARVKHVVDGLKPFLIDDSDEWLTLVVHSTVEPGVKAVRMVLEEIAA